MKKRKIITKRPPNPLIEYISKNFKEHINTVSEETGIAPDIIIELLADVFLQVQEDLKKSGNIINFKQVQLFKSRKL